MSGKGKYLLDTNVLIDYFNDRLPDQSARLIDKIIGDAPQISVITEIELLGYVGTVEENVLFKYFVDTSEVLTLDRAIVAKTIELRKQKKIKLPDAIIAATAIVYDITLISRNFDDFKNIQGLKFQDSFRI